jgi:Fe-S-cluster containining protein
MEPRMTNRCETCKGLCCRYFCFQIDEPDDYEEFEDVRWYLYHEGVSVHIDEDGDWFIQIANVCTALDENYRCKVYENRPLICRGYSTDNCEVLDDDYGYREEFTSPDQLDAYARKTLGRETYEKDMIKHRAKAHGLSKKEMRKHMIHVGLLRDSGTDKPGKTTGKKKDKKKHKKKHKKK